MYSTTKQVKVPVLMPEVEERATHVLGVWQGTGVDKHKVQMGVLVQQQEWLY